MPGDKASNGGPMASLFQPFKDCVGQVCPGLFETQRTLEKLTVMARDAARGGTKLGVFPGVFVGGQPLLEAPIRQLVAAIK